MTRAPGSQLPGVANPEGYVVGPVPVNRIAESELPARHYAEATGDDASWRPFNPDWDTYRTLASVGALICIGAVERSSGQLVGYVLAPKSGGHVHSMTTAFVGVDALYVAPEHRGGPIAKELVRQLIATARAGGAREILTHVAEGKAAHRLLARLGFQAHSLNLRMVL